MLFSVEQTFVGREEIRAPLKTPAWEASRAPADVPLYWAVVLSRIVGRRGYNPR